MQLPFRFGEYVLFAGAIIHLSGALKHRWETGNMELPFAGRSLATSAALDGAEFAALAHWRISSEQLY